MGIYLNELSVSKVLHYQAIEVWGDLKVGSKVDLQFDKKDKEVKVKFREKEKKEWLVIGILSQEESKIIRDILVAGWKDFFECWICKKRDDGPYDQRISIVVHIREKLDQSEKPKSAKNENSQQDSKGITGNCKPNPQSQGEDKPTEE